MIQKTSPKAIGAFVTVSAVLLVAMVFFFGASSLITKSERFILFFDQSVNGLDQGSTVKFRGVPVGSVERILIRSEGQRKNSTAIPVIIKLDRSRLERDLGVSEAAFSPETIHESIEEGLVAELNLESFITGQLFVEFSFAKEELTDWEPHLDQENGMIEIPTLGSSFDEIAADVANVVSKLNAVDVKRLNENANAVLESLNAVLEGIDSEGISESVMTAAAAVERFASSQDVAGTITALKEVLETVNKTITTYDLEDGPLAKSVGALTKHFQDTLTGFDALLADVGSLISPESSFRYEMETTLRELGRVAQSLRLLADYLERNPNALLTGRPEDEE